MFLFILCWYFIFLGRVEAYVLYVRVSDICDDTLYPHRMREGE